MTTNYELFLSAIRTGDDERTEDAVQALWRNGDGSLASLLDLAVIDREIGRADPPSGARREARHVNLRRPRGER